METPVPIRLITMASRAIQKDAVLVREVFLDISFRVSG
jgi:hypothetical protein